MGQYERRTQLAPAGVVLAPVSLLIVLLFVPAGNGLASLVRFIVTAIVGAGPHLVVMRHIRDRGNEVQKALWELWGGAPTTQRLRWRGARAADVQRLHCRVQAKTKIKLPTRGEEEADPDETDRVYVDAAAQLRETTRDQGAYPRVWSELMGYGMARNLYAVRRLGTIFAAATLLVSVFLTVLSLTGTWHVAWWAPAGGGVGAVLAGAMWVFVFTPAWVRVAADRYADALLSTAEEPRGESYSQS